MAYFLWFDNDNLDYGGIGAVDYDNSVERHMPRSLPAAKKQRAANDNPPPDVRPAKASSLYSLMEQTVAGDRDF